METSEIIRRAGGPVHVAVQLGRSHSTVIGWRRVPAEHAPTVARLAGLTPHDVRPDVYGPSDTGPVVEECAA